MPPKKKKHLKQQVKIKLVSCKRTFSRCARLLVTFYDYSTTAALKIGAMDGDFLFWNSYLTPWTQTVASIYEVRDHMDIVYILRDVTFGHLSVHLDSL
jgi:hypothetical protein